MRHLKCASALKFCKSQSFFVENGMACPSHWKDSEAQNYISAAASPRTGRAGRISGFRGKADVRLGNEAHFGLEDMKAEGTWD